MEKAKSTKLTKRNPIKPEVKKIIRQLKNTRLSIREIPIEFASDINILRVERELGIRKTILRGFDVINQEFFVEEELLSQDFEVLYSPKKHSKTFKNITIILKATYMKMLVIINTNFPTLFQNQ